MDDEAIKEGARRIAAALRSPAGQVKLARVVGAHLDWFDLVQHRGLSWDQMIRVLADAGAMRENGLPFSRGHLSSTVWRARQERQQEIAVPPQQPPPPRPAFPQTQAPAARSARETFRSNETAQDSGASPSAPTDKGNLRDYMRRAAEARRRAEDG
ncbi:MAG: hypothetical protein AB7L90_23360 [Hyphomicrobiaceae bacterium]